MGRIPASLASHALSFLVLLRENRIFIRYQADTWITSLTSTFFAFRNLCTSLISHLDYLSCKGFFFQYLKKIYFLSSPSAISRWVDKTIMRHLHSGIPLGCKKRENFTLWDSMDGPGERYAEWKKPVRGRQIAYDFTHMWNLMKTELTSTIETHRWRAG